MFSHRPRHHAAHWANRRRRARHHDELSTNDNDDARCRFRLLTLGQAFLLQISTALARRGIKPSFGYAQPIDKTYRQVEFADGRDAVFARDDQTADVNAVRRFHFLKLLNPNCTAHRLRSTSHPAHDSNQSALVVDLGRRAGGVGQLDDGDRRAASAENARHTVHHESAAHSPTCRRARVGRARCAHGTMDYANLYAVQEKHAFFARITESVVCRESARRDEMIECLQTHVGLDSLVHPLCEWFVCGVQQNIATKNLALLIYLSRELID